MMWFILAAFILLLFVLSKTKFEVRHEVVIDSRVEKVWQAVIDFSNYKQWNSQLSYFGGAIVPTVRLHLKLSAEGAKPYEFKPLVSHYKENEVFGWIAKTGITGVFDGEHFFELKAKDNEQTLLVNREEYRGVLSLFMKQLPAMKAASKGFEKMNLELKHYFEKN
jgi:hypothetical protein